jgi:hypothetical protein
MVSPLVKITRKLEYLKKPATIVLVIFIVLMTPMFTVSPVFANYQGVNVLVAYDEELEWTASWVYWYTPQTFCWLFVDCVSDRFESAFGLRFNIIRYVFWDSNDSVTDDIEAFEREVVAETGFYTGMTYNTIRIDILIAFSDQTIADETGIYLGKANSTLGTAIVFEYYEWRLFQQFTDNILQHELSHLYKCPEEAMLPSNPNYDCVMNSGLYVYYPFPVDDYIKYCLTTENWCINCRNTINLNRERWGREVVEGGGPGGPGGPYPLPESGGEVELEP